MIEAEQLTKRYGPVTAVDHLTFTACPGHVTGFLGPNGANKTTTARILATLLAPDTGLPGCWATTWSTAGCYQGLGEDRQSAEVLQDR